MSIINTSNKYNVQNYNYIEDYNYMEVMPMGQLYIEENRKEIKAHGDYHFPVNISEESIGKYEGGAFPWHWHPEIELTWIQSGQIEYCVNENRYTLSEGDGLFCTTNALHAGYMVDNQNCDYLSITFHPRFIYGYEGSLLHTKYVDYITTNAQWSSLKLDQQIDWQREIVEKIQKIYQMSLNPPMDFELQVHIELSMIWQKLFDYFSNLPEPSTRDAEHLSRLKTILVFIHEHYSEPISLEDIAASVNICRSECCRFFKKHMHMTLFEYLMFYRIQQSLPLLKSNESVTKIAGMVGFSNPCYYGKIFKRYMNCSPSQYKRESQ